MLFYYMSLFLCGQIGRCNGTHLFFKSFFCSCLSFSFCFPLHPCHLFSFCLFNCMYPPWTTNVYCRLEGIDLASCHFTTLLVDPPRAGLDEGTLSLLPDFDRVLYISCNPDTLKRDVGAVADTFQVERMALFDQFPYTHHAECGVLLVKREHVQKKGGGGEAGTKRKAEEATAADTDNRCGDGKKRT
jgi:hypothetical protein